MDLSCGQFRHLVPKPSDVSSAKHLGEAQVEPFPGGVASPNQIKLMI